MNNKKINRKFLLNKERILFVLLMLFLFMACYELDKKKNRQSSFQPGELWFDTEGNHINAHGGGFLFFNDIYYWFGEHKRDGKFGSMAYDGVRVYTSKDLYNWKNEGIALQVVDNVKSKLQKGCTLERPKVIYNKKTRKFVMWFHHELKDQGYKAALTGVAVSNKAIGPYNYIDSFRIHAGVLPQNFDNEDFLKAEEITNRKDENWKDKIIKGSYFVRDFEDGQMSRDMTLFVDDDNTAYHITASEENQTLFISKLSEDYTSLTGEYVRVFPGGRNEAPAIFKSHEKYFMFSSGLTGWKPNPGKLSVADSIMGDWRLLGNPCEGTDDEKKTTFWSQSTFVIPVKGKKDAFIFAADRWRPKNHSDGRYVWLPIQFNNEIPYIQWSDSWNLSVFNEQEM